MLIRLPSFFRYFAEEFIKQKIRRYGNEFGKQLEMKLFQFV